MRVAALALILDLPVLGQSSSSWGEVRLSIGAFLLAGGSDVHFQARLNQSHWMAGYRFVQWTDIFHDPFTGRRLTETTYTLKGPTLVYLTRPSATGTWIWGGSVLQWSSKEKWLYTGEVGKDSTTAAFLGGGYMWSWHPMFCQLAIYLAPGARLKTNTSGSSEDSSGGFDIQIHLGFRL